MEAAQSQLTFPTGSWGERFAWRTRIRIGIVAALILLVYWSPINGYIVARWIHDPNWSHGWLIPAFCLYFIYDRREALRRCAFRPSTAGGVVLALSLGFDFVFAWEIPMTYPQSLTLIGTIIGSVWLLGGFGAVRILWFPIFFLALAIPLPQRLYFQVTTPLREWASTAAAALIPLFVEGLHTEAQAVVIDYITPDGRTGQLNVEEACSGMRLLMAFVTLGLTMAYLGNRPVWQRLVLVASCIPIALFCNTIRVTFTGWLTVTGRTDLAQGTPHHLLGLAMLALALGLYAAIGYVLSHLWIDVSDSATSEGATEGSSA